MAALEVNGFQRQPHSSERGLFMASPWSRDSATSSVNRHSYSPTGNWAAWAGYMSFGPSAAALGDRPLWLALEAA